MKLKDVKPGYIYKTDDAVMPSPFLVGTFGHNKICFIYLQPTNAGKKFYILWSHGINYCNSTNSFLGPENKEDLEVEEIGQLPTIEDF